MEIRTLGELRDWLLETPRTRLETLRAADATPEDVASAISLLVAGNFLCRPVTLGSRLAFRARKLPGVQMLLKTAIVGSHQRNRDRDRHLLGPWIDEAVRSSAHEWMALASAISPSAAASAEAAMIAEELLQRRLGRRASDREARLFWKLVDEFEPPVSRGDADAARDDSELSFGAFRSARR